MDALTALVANIHGTKRKELASTAFYDLTYAALEAYSAVPKDGWTLAQVTDHSERVSAAIWSVAAEVRGRADFSGVYILMHSMDNLLLLLPPEDQVMALTAPRNGQPGALTIVIDLAHSLVAQCGQLFEAVDDKPQLKVLLAEAMCFLARFVHVCLAARAVLAPPTSSTFQHLLALIWSLISIGKAPAFRGECLASMCKFMHLHLHVSFMRMLVVLCGC